MLYTFFYVVTIDVIFLDGVTFHGCGLFNWFNQSGLFKLTQSKDLEPESSSV